MIMTHGILHSNQNTDNLLVVSEGACVSGKPVCEYSVWVSGGEHLLIPQTSISILMSELVDEWMSEWLSDQRVSGLGE